MRKITLVNENGEVLGMGYMGDSQQDINALKELRRRVRRSRINANLEIEEVDTMDMTELGDRMAEYQENIDMLEGSLEDEEENVEFDGYNMDILQRLLNSR